MSEAVVFNSSNVKSWRHDAARIVEELFRVTEAEAWDLLIDLRQSILQGADWNKTLDVFLACRERLELANYLPFYRLRMLITSSLTLEMGGDQAQVAPLRQILRGRHRSLADIERQVARELFEHGLDVAVDRPLDLQVVERE